MGERQRTYAELEAGAATIVDYQPAVVPGLLQPPAYARLRIAAGRLLRPSLDVEADVRARPVAGGAARATRRATRRCSPSRPATAGSGLPRSGGAVAAPGRLTGCPNVTIRMLPRGRHGRWRAHPLTPYSRYSFPDPADPRTVMLEALTTDVRSGHAADVDRYEQITGGAGRRARPGRDGRGAGPARRRLTRSGRVAPPSGPEQVGGAPGAAAAGAQPGLRRRPAPGGPAGPGRAHRDRQRSTSPRGNRARPPARRDRRPARARRTIAQAYDRFRPARR